MTHSSLHIIILAGESSGDILGADLIHALRRLRPDCVIEGIAGSKMIEAGCCALYATEDLSVMGIIDPLKCLPRLLRIRRGIIKHVLKTKPDVFVGIDFPDFNLSIERVIKKAGIKTVHYVSPSVWAWRKRRIHKIKRAVDLMLTLLPFETTIYKEHQVPVQYVGHPLADQIPLYSDQMQAREKLGLSKDAKILAILPGSRQMELKELANIFIQTARLCLNRMPHLVVVTSMINASRRAQFETYLKSAAPYLSIKIFDQQSQEVMLASDVVLLASGTVTLEAMLLKRPMVVAYRLSRFHYFIARCLITIKYFSLPNLIANRKIVPEFLQNDVTPSNLSAAVLHYFNDAGLCRELTQTYLVLHQLLKQDASMKAAEYILNAFVIPGHARSA
ncbi:MAG: lipid-A-disaccharide synthase [Gammaproteobacteria bacterium RIFCSPHIGHO2_02_FULL_42_13]|nr:MAG: lipid-A-disaccharide synthase [Gammaproteobacteria bacterium RIFCSPHIGHO2_02_FULL_42_13]